MCGIVIVAGCTWQCGFMGFVGVKWESGTPVLHLSLITAETLLAIIKACILPSTIINSKCVINEKADVLFHEVIKQKIIGHVIHFCK